MPDLKIQFSLVDAKPEIQAFCPALVEQYAPIPINTALGVAFAKSELNFH